MLNVLIDDTRDLPGMDLIIRNDLGFYCVIDSLRNRSFYLFLDHDLGCTSDGKDVTGYTLIKYMLSEKIFPNIIDIITCNPIGRKNIENVLKDYEYTKTSSIQWVNKYYNS